MLLGCSLPPPVSEIGVLLVVIVGILWLVALWRLLLFSPARFSLTDGLLLILLLGLSLIAAGGLVELRSLCSALPSGLLLGCLLSKRAGGPNRFEVQRVWELYDERLQYMSRQDAMQLDESLDAGDVSRAWLVRSRAAEIALVDASQISGGAIPDRGLVLGRGNALFRVVKLGGHKVRKVGGNAADVDDAADVFCIAILLLPLA